MLVPFLRASILRALIASPLTALLLAPHVTAQTLTIRMVNGNSGKPMPDKNVFVTFWWDDPTQPVGRQRVRVGFPNDTGGTDIPLDKHGFGQIEIPKQATLVQVESVENVVIYGKRGQYLTCNITGKQFMEPGEMWTAGRQIVPLSEIQTRGFVPQTDCTPRVAVHPAPGEFVILTLPDHCWPLCGLVW